MAVIEYDHSPNISSEQRLRSLADSVRRAFKELDAGLENYADKKHNHIISDITDLKLNATTAAQARQNLGFIFDVGSIAGENIAPGAYRDVPIIFNKTFSAPPIVFFNLYSSSESSDIGKISAAYVPNSGSATGCTVRIFNGSTATRAPGLEWKAMDRQLFI